MDKKYLIKAKIMLFIETILLILTIISLFWLKNVIVGYFYVIFIVGIFIWLFLIIITMSIYNKAKVN
ncbi:MAG: hypothetical protein ACFFBW_15000 [Promethearchaeota archaeon]